jgi:hypothetical protein
VEDTVVWDGDDFPNLKEWDQAALVAQLEAQMQMLTPAFGEVGDTPNVEGPVIQRNRYLKFGRKIREFAPFAESAPEYV